MSYLSKVKELRKFKKDLERIKESLEITIKDARKSYEENYLLIQTLSATVFAIEEDLEDLDNRIFGHLILNKSYEVKEVHGVDFEEYYIN